MKFFDKCYFANLQAGAAIYGMKVDEDFIHYGIENQPFYAYSSLYLPNLLSLRF